MSTTVKNVEENKERSKRIFRFGVIALFVMFMNAVLDFIRHLSVSGMFVLLMAVAISIILWVIRKGYARGTVAAIVFTVNPLLVLIAFAEGLKTGGYLFILPVLFALTFMIGSIKIYAFEMASYFFVTIASFCVCILFCGQTSNWQHIPLNLYTQMFTFNSICVVCLCAAFSYMGIYFEREYKAALTEAKDRAELQEQEIKAQNEHLERIAFMNSHIVRSPLANIMAIAELMEDEKKPAGLDKELIHLLKISAYELDDNIKEIVAKATNQIQNSRI
ncbi:MAG TPA: hypothetical protein VGI61_03955 [Parafilimonas sp.]